MAVVLSPTALHMEVGFGLKTRGTDGKPTPKSKMLSEHAHGKAVGSYAVSVRQIMVLGSRYELFEKRLEPRRQLKFLTGFHKHLRGSEADFSA